MNRKIILASTSAYRRQLLQRLGIAFDVVAPDIDESALPGESARDRARRLSERKALAVAAQVQEPALVIGSDQVADLGGQHIGKPGSKEQAVLQLAALRGREVVFHSGIAVVASRGGPVRSTVVSTQVKMRDYAHGEIERYVDREPAFDCAGSAKSEGLGIALIESIRSDDPTALIGLPLIATLALLREHGLEVL